MPPKPSAAALRSASTGKISPSSQSRACGIICSRANCRAVAWKARCSSVRVKSILYSVAPGLDPGVYEACQGLPPPIMDEAGADSERLDLPTRLRRNRRSDWARRMVRENQLTTDDLIWPLFVMEGDNARVPVPSMPGVERLTVDQAVREAERAAKLTIPCLALFPYTDPSLRDETGSEALNPDNLVCRAIRAIKKEVPEIGLLCDVALDPFTSHGHDGLLRDGEILNDETVAVLVKQAVVQAQAGCDIIAPSDMMDGRVGAIRKGLDAENFLDVP